MIQKFIHRLFRHRHFWRYATFSEIAELYMSKMLRSLALSMASAFLSVYLFQNGYSLLFIALFWTVFYVFRAFLALPASALAAWIGPKHGILISNLLYIPAMIAFALLPEFGPWLLIIVIVFQGSSTTLHTVCHMITFSKVKSVEHAGKEMAYMNIIEKVTTSLSPLVGGLLAFILGPQAVLVIAAVIFVFAAVPLLRTKEPTLQRQKLRFKGFSWHLVRGTFASQVALGFDIFTSGNVWWLFTAIVIIGMEEGNGVYAANGLLLSVVLVAALGSSYVVGKLIDRRRGLELLRISVVFDALTHVMRPFIGTPVAAAGLNIAKETATTGYALAYNRGIYDNADLSGTRIAYIGVQDTISTIGAALSAATFSLLLLLVSDQRAMEYLFIITAGVVLLIATARFPLYRK